MNKQLKFYLFLLISSLTTKLQAQDLSGDYDYKPPVISQAYVNIGLGSCFTKKTNAQTHGTTLQLAATVGLQNKLLFRTGLQSSMFNDNSRDYSHIRIEHIPYYYISHYYAGIGKRHDVSKYLTLQVFGALSYNKCEEPANISYSNSIFANFLGSNYTYEKKITKRAGFLVQAEITGITVKCAGLTIGTYCHFIPHFSTAGITLSINLGKVRPA